ncbi:FAD-dependent monooxygenase [Jiangella endophytica]|uniref:FAD-dependent monooxygenase n=1 Tax=Jiangella endophytica TaxID=1623398 RepID=UPI000E343324|nr:FAD-dependent monooxygenase [Jiangella endophytica]
MRKNGRRALVIGAGIGGAAAGIALRRAGFETVVFERAPSLGAAQVGGCYVLWYAGVLSLGQLGLGDAAAKIGHPVERFEMCDARGRVLNGLDVGKRGQALGAMPIAVRRTELIAALHDELGAGSLRLGSTLTRVEQDGRGVTAVFADGSTERGDLMVGADGLKSVVRSGLHPKAAPRHPGYAHWFGIADGDGGAPDGVFRILHGKGARFAFFHLGGGKVCWWFVRNAAQGQDGDVLGDPAAITRFVNGWHPTAAALVEATPAGGIRRRDTYDQAPRRRWGADRVTMLGDAAHAMTFNLGQGAGASLTDAVVLGRQLGAGGGLLASLRGYERIRRARTLLLVWASRQVGDSAAWDSRIGAAANATILRTVGALVTPSLLELDTRRHPALAAS